MINLYDANSWLRRTFEVDTSGLAFRNIYDEAQLSGDVNIYVWDGFGGNDARRAIYPAYKTNRKPAGENIYAALKFARELLNHTPALQIKIDGYEADDVIAHLARRLSPKNAVKIWTTDGDLTALCTTPGVTCSREPTKGLSPEHVQLYKVCVGDPSDNISGIKGFGEKTWAAVADKARLRQLLYGTENYEDLLIEIGVPKGVARWIVAHRIEIDATIDVIAFQALDPVVVNRHTTAGTRNPEAAEALLAQCLM